MHYLKHPIFLLVEKRNAMRSIDDIIDNLKELDEEENDDVSCDNNETKTRNVDLMKDNINRDNEAGSININNINNIENINEDSFNCIDDTKIKYIPKIKKKNYKWGAYNKNINILPTSNSRVKSQQRQTTNKHNKSVEAKNDITGSYIKNFEKYASSNKLVEDSSTCSKDNEHLCCDKQIFEEKNTEEEEEDDGTKGLWCMDGKRLSNLCGRLLGGFNHQHYKMHMHLLSQQEDYLPVFDTTRYFEIEQNICQETTKDKANNIHSFKNKNEQQPPQTQQPKNFNYQEEEQFYFQQKLDMQQQQKNQEKQKPFFTKNQKQLQNTCIPFAKPYLVSQKTHTILNKTSSKTVPTTVQPMAINATIINILKPTSNNTELSKLIPAPSTIAIKTTMNIASTSNFFSTFTTPINLSSFDPTVTTSICKFSINTHSNFNGALDSNPSMQNSTIRSILYTSNESIFTQTTSYSPSTKLMLITTQSSKIFDSTFSSLASKTSSSLSSLLSSLSSSSSSSEANILLYSKKLDRLTRKLDDDLAREFDERLKLIDNSQEMVSFVDKEKFPRDKLLNYVNFNMVHADNPKSCAITTSSFESLKQCNNITNELKSYDKNIERDNFENFIIDQSNEKKFLPTKSSFSSNSSPSSSVITVVKNPLKPAVPPKPIFSKQQKESMHLRTSRPKSCTTSTSHSKGSSEIVSQVKSPAFKPTSFKETFDSSSSCPPSVITKRKNLNINSNSEELLNNVNMKLKSYGSLKGDHFKQKLLSSYNLKNFENEIKYDYNYNFLGKNISDKKFDDIWNKDLFCSLDKLPLKKGLSSRSLSNNRRSFCKKVEVVTTTTRTEEEVFPGSSNRSNYKEENIDVKKDILFDGKTRSKLSGGLHCKAVGYQVNGERKFYYEPKENSSDFIKQKLEQKKKLENIFLNKNMNQFKEKDGRTKKTDFSIEDKVFEKGLQELKNNQHYLVYYDSNNKARQEQTKQSCDFKTALEGTNFDLFRSNLGNLCFECPEKEELNSAQKLFKLLNESRLYREGSTDE